MQLSDRKQFVETLNGLAAIKPGKDLTREAIELWWNSMQAWSITDFKAAAAHLAGSVEFMPSPFHFEQLRKATKPIAAEAWRTVLQRCVHWRQPRDTRVEDIIDRAVAGIGGYREVAMADLETAMPHVQRRFLEAYAQLEEVETVRCSLPELKAAPGINYRDGKFTAIGSPILGAKGKSQAPARAEEEGA